MNHKKRIVIALILVLCSLAVCSCGLSSFKNSKDSSSESDPRAWGYDDYPFAKEAMMTILKCFDENDSETLEGLFSEEMTKGYDLKKQIEEAQEFYEGTSVSCGKFDYYGLMESNFNKDHYEYKRIEAGNREVITDKDKTYHITYDYILVDDDPTKIGILTLHFRNPNDANKRFLKIGYGSEE